MKKPNFRLMALPFLLVGLGLASSAQAAWLLDLTDTNGGLTNVGSNSGGPILKSVTGAYIANGASDVGFGSGATWAANNLTNYSGNGQGMSTGAESVAPTHALDNNGNTEAVLLNFNSSVVLKEIGLGYTSIGSATTVNGNLQVDVSLFRWTGIGVPNGTPAGNLVGLGGATMAGWQLVGNYGDLVYDTSSAYNLVNTANLGSSWWLISAYNSGFASSGVTETRAGLDNGNDYFKLFAVAGTSCAGAGTPCGALPPGVPEPGSLALVAIGLVGALSVRRRTLRSNV